uniref:Ensconsin-like n=1 Tax=Nicotiana tabacum TaxID=4097 RepID=A0A1S4AB91_TOBAC|nr:PREDICTED: ensconsin-like [Nicotiana tabacum]
MRLSFGSLPLSVDKQPTTSIALATTTSYPLTPSVSSPFSPTLPSPPATAASSPPTAIAREEDAPLPQSPVYGNLGLGFRERLEKNTYSPRNEIIFEANFLASEGLQRLIRDKEELTFERDQLLAELDQTGARLSELEAPVAKAVELEARLQQSEQENNLEVALNSNAKELVVAEEKYVRLEEKYKKIIEHNRIYSSNVCDFDVSLRSMRSARDNHSAEVSQLKEKLQRQAASLMRRKTLKKDKEGVTDFDVEIAKARELALAAKRGLPARPDATDSSGSGSEFLETEEEPEGEDVEGQNIEPAAYPPTFPGGVDVFLPPASGDAAT